MDSTLISIFVVPMLIWVVGMTLSLVYRWRSPKKYKLTLIAFICLLGSYAGLFGNLPWLIPAIFTIAGWFILFLAIFNPKFNPTDREKPSKEEKILFLKAIGIGMGSGVVGAIVGFFPILLLHYKLWDLVKNTDMPHELIYLFVGYPMPWVGLIFLPVGGAIFGCIGSLIGLKKHPRRLWLWGGLAGLLFNFFVSFNAT